MKKPNIPKHLSRQAKMLFQSIVDEYTIDDSGGLAILATACEAWDRAKQAREAIETDGLILEDRFKQKKLHPAATVERDARSQWMQAIKNLGLDPGEVQKGV
jgi:P27 family predicted phage terminase small subunit